MVEVPTSQQVQTPTAAALVLDVKELEICALVSETIVQIREADVKRLVPDVIMWDQVVNPSKKKPQEGLANENFGGRLHASDGLPPHNEIAPSKTHDTNNNNLAEFRS